MPTFILTKKSPAVARGAKGESSCAPASLACIAAKSRHHHHRAHITLRALRICHGAVRAPQKNRAPADNWGSPYGPPSEWGWRGWTVQQHNNRSLRCSALIRKSSPPRSSGWSPAKHVSGE